MTLPAAAETSAVDERAKSAKPKPAARKRAPAKRTATSRPRSVAAKPRVEATTPEPEPAAPQGRPRTPRTHVRAVAAFALLLAAAVAASVLLLGDGDDVPATTPTAAVEVSPTELAARAEELGAPVYWAGSLPGRTLELTSSATGAFVRYLPAGAPVGGEDRTLTIATYPMRDAYGTATTRAKAAGMASSPIRNGGLAVWSRAQPTSVYVAWRGVPSLVEVYAPRAADARSTALGGRVRPVG